MATQKGKGGKSRSGRILAEDALAVIGFNTG
jgi:hypothetical protein